MTIASKTIAGCSPIASQACITPPMTIVFWQNQSVVFEPFLGVSLVIQFWFNQSEVFRAILYDPNASGDCITAYDHHRMTTAYPRYEDAVACSHNPDMTVDPLNNEVPTSANQKCKEAA